MLFWAFWVDVTWDLMSATKAALLPFMLTTFWVWPISCEALKVESILVTLKTGRKGTKPPRTARMARASSSSVIGRSLMARVVVMAVLLGSDWDFGSFGLSICAALRRYKRMECAKAGHAIADRPQTQAGPGKKVS